MQPAQALNCRPGSGWKLVCLCLCHTAPLQVASTLLCSPGLQQFTACRMKRDAYVRRWCSGCWAWLAASSLAQSGGWACSRALASSPAQGQASWRSHKPAFAGWWQSCMAAEGSQGLPHAVNQRDGARTDLLHFAPCTTSPLCLSHVATCDIILTRACQEHDILPVRLSGASDKSMCP